MNEVELFIIFLKDRSIYDIFLDGLITNTSPHDDGFAPYGSIEGYIQYLLDNHNYNNAVAHAFNWDRVHNNGIEWVEIHDEWDKIATYYITTNKYPFSLTNNKTLEL